MNSFSSNNPSPFHAPFAPLPSRRSFLWRLGGGLGGIALSHLLSNELQAAPPQTARAFQTPPPFPARARRAIQLFMNGGASQMDLFDYKPSLFQRAGQKFDPGGGQRVEAPTSEPGKILKPPYAMAQAGQSGRWITSLYPHLAQCVDDMAFLMSMVSKTNVHGPASYLMNTGFILPGFPCLGAWVSYALGNLTDNLPTFVVLPDSRGLPYNQRGNFNAGFLPVTHQGTVINAAAPSAIPDLHLPPSARSFPPASEPDALQLLGQWNRSHAQSNEADSRLEARIQAYELAARMQLSAPEAFDLSRETHATRTLYGLHNPITEDFGRRCLIARRLIERGVRFVQVWSGAGGASNNWDNHTSIEKELPPMCAATDQPMAALLKDLKARGLWDDTLVLWNTEFGRMPFTQGAQGRDHNGGTFVGWLAGAGIRSGTAVGESDEWSWKGSPNSVTTYDFHATVLHLLGLDHERLAYRHNGFNRRLTDVHGEVIHGVLS